MHAKCWGSTDFEGDCDIGFGKAILELAILDFLIKTIYTWTNLVPVQDFHVVNRAVQAWNVTGNWGMEMLA
jgi:hypothetical protein